MECNYYKDKKNSTNTYNTYNESNQTKHYNYNNSKNMNQKYRTKKNFANQSQQIQKAFNSEDSNSNINSRKTSFQQNTTNCFEPKDNLLNYNQHFQFQSHLFPKFNNLPYFVNDNYLNIQQNPPMQQQTNINNEYTHNNFQQIDNDNSKEEFLEHRNDDHLLEDSTCYNNQFPLGTPFPYQSNSLNNFIKRKVYNNSFEYYQNYLDMSKINYPNNMFQGLFNTLTLTSINNDSNAHNFSNAPGSYGSNINPDLDQNNKLVHYNNNISNSNEKENTIKDNFQNPNIILSKEEKINKSMNQHQPNRILNESISTTNTGLTTYTQTSPKNNYNMPCLSNSELYLLSKYPDICHLQRKFSSPEEELKVVKNSTYYIIKSFNIENIHKAIKYGVWATTYSGNNTFDKAFADSQKRNSEVYLFFSTNSTFAFQGIAKLKSGYQNQSYCFWKGSDKYRNFQGSFKIEWVIIKDIPNTTLDKVRINDIPFSKLRNCVEIPESDAMKAVKIIEKFYYCSSLVLSDFMRLDKEEAAVFTFNRK